MALTMPCCNLFIYMSALPVGCEVFVSRNHVLFVLLCLLFLIMPFPLQGFNTCLINELILKESSVSLAPGTPKPLMVISDSGSLKLIWIKGKLQNSQLYHRAPLAHSILMEEWDLAPRLQTNCLSLFSSVVVAVFFIKM